MDTSSMSTNRTLVLCGNYLLELCLAPLHKRAHILCEWKSPFINFVERFKLTTNQVMSYAEGFKSIRCLAWAISISLFGTLSLPSPLKKDTGGCIKG